MTASKSTVIYDSYWRWSIAFYRAFLLLGRLPIEIREDGKEAILSVRSWAWAVFSACIQMVLVAWSNVFRVWSADFWENYEKVLESLSRIIATSAAPEFVAAWWSAPHVVRYVTQWPRIEEEFHSVTGSYVLPLNPWIVRCYLFSFTILTILLLILDQYLFQHYFEICLLFPYFFSVYYSLVLTNFWVYHCYFIIQAAKTYRLQLIKMLNSSPNPEGVESYRLLWVRLQGSVTQLAAALSAMVATQLLTHFGIFVINSYTLVRAVCAGDAFRAIGFSTPFIWTLVTIVAFCQSSYFVSVQIGRTTLLGVLSVKMQSMSFNTRLEVDLLIDAIAGNSFPLELAGFITLDRSLAVQITSTTITYLIVLTQFDYPAVKAVVDATSE